MKSRSSRSKRVLDRYRKKVKARTPSPVVKSGRNSFRVTDFTFKVQVKKKGRLSWKTVKAQTISPQVRRVRIRRGENKGKLRKVTSRPRLSSSLALPPSHTGRVGIYYKGKKLAETKLRKGSKRLTPKRLRRTLQGGNSQPPNVQGTPAVPVREIYQTWDPLLGQLPQAAWWHPDAGVFFNATGDLRRVRSKFRVWFVVELPPETVSKDSFKMYQQAPTSTDSVFYLTFFVIEIDRADMIEAARVIRRGPLFSRRAEEALNKHNEGDADHPWVAVRAFIGIEALG